MAPRGAGVSYSQARRNEEVAAREEARSLVPPKYFDAAVKADGKNNTTTKTLKGVIAYLKEIGGDTSSVNNATQQGSAGYVTATTNSQVSAPSVHLCSPYSRSAGRTNQHVPSTLAANRSTPPSLAAGHEPTGTVHSDTGDHGRGDDGGADNSGGSGE